MSFFAELKRRNVFRMALLYLVSSWLILQVADVLSGLFGLPEWTLRLIGFILLLGFPFALLFSWIYELTPEGLKKESGVDPDRSTGQRTGGKLNVALVAVLVLAIGLFVGQSFWEGEEQAVVDPAPQRTSEPKTDGSIARLGPKSIAVLPFSNFSSAKDDAHFSNGLADTVLHRLAQVDDLAVIARNSSFVYQGDNVDVRQVGEELGVANVLEGSVQRQGEQLRVIAQLVETTNGTHLWSDTFDRTLADIFSIQDEISLAVTQALQVELLGDEVGRLTGTGTDDATAWALYLAAREILDGWQYEDHGQAYELLTQAIDRDPRFVEAYQALATLFNYRAWNSSSEQREDALRNGFEAISRAIALDPAHPDNLVVLGSLKRRDWETTEAMALFEAYLQFNPNDAAAHAHLGLAQHDAGLFARAYESFQEAYRLDPKHGLRLRQLGLASFNLRRQDEANAWLQRGLDEYGWPLFANDQLRFYRYLGRWDLSIEAVATYLMPNPDPVGLEGLHLSLLALGLFESSQRLRTMIAARVDDPQLLTRLDLGHAQFAGNELDPESDTSEYAMWSCLLAEDYDCVLETFARDGKRYEATFSTVPFLSSADDVLPAACLGLAELRSGDSSRGLRLLRAALDRAEADVQAGETGCNLRDCSSLTVAELKAALGDTAGAIEALQGSLTDDDAFLRWGLIPNSPIENSPFLTSTREEPAFEQFVAEMLRRQSRMAQRAAPLVEQILKRIESGE